MKTEILRIKTEGKSQEFKEVLQHFKQYLITNPKSCRSYVTCFMQGMFFYDNVDYLYMTVENFHRLATENNLNLDEKEYILITYKEDNK